MTTVWLFCLLALSYNVNAESPIKHVIVLMMENRSFDHILGWLHTSHPAIEGLTGNEYNLHFANRPDSKKVYVNHNGFDRAPDDPGHSWTDTAFEIYGKHVHGDEKPVPHMSGFVEDALHKKHHPENPMSMFNITTAPILNTLALEFAVFDHWFCSVPGPTSPNRQFAMASTSLGYLQNWNGTLFPQQTYMDWLRVKGKTFRAYYQDDPWVIMHFKDMHEPINKRHVFELDQFYTDLKNGKLPDFVWLQPRMTSVHGPPTWQHPDALVSEGERLIKSLYEAMRKSPLWNQLAFVITYDEHGGFYDHVHPPQHGIPNPDGRKALNGFNFDRLGVRIPTVLVSPWVAKNKVISQPKQGGPHFDATSVIATSNKIFGVTGHMTARDAWVGTFEDVFQELKAPRTDCPMNLPSIPAYTDEEMRLQHSLPLNDHLEEQIGFYCRENNHGPDCGKGISNQYEASVFIVKEAKKFMQKN